MSNYLFKDITRQFLSRLCLVRPIYTSPILQAQQDNARNTVEDYLQLRIEEKENETYVATELTNTGREGKLINLKSDTACALCRLNLRNLHYTDVMILSQFIKKDGSLATYHESKLCAKQYNKIKALIKQAHRCNLIQRPADYFVPGGWHDLNTYLEPDRRRDQPMKVIKKEYWKL